MTRPTHMLAVLALVPLLSLAGIAPAAPDDGTTDACGSLEAVTVGDDVLCIKAHAEPPPNLTAGERADTSPIPDVAPTCLSDGRDGFRVQPLYVHEEGAPNDLASLAPRLRRELGRVDWTVRSSAERDGGYRAVRWLTEAGDDGTCRVALTSVALPAADLADFDRTVSALAERGYDRTDRRYLLFAARDDYCGIATLTSDDRVGAANTVHHSTGYARVDRACWFLGARGGHSTAAHELFHTLGAVQTTAPNATSLGHCTDEWDPMCYADGDDVRVQVRCTDGNPDTVDELDRNNRFLDCGADDYFNANPRARSYLDTHWNTADAAFLTVSKDEGPGHPDGAPTRPADPQGRPLTWPADRGTWRPTVAHGGGFEACDVPIVVRPRGTEEEQQQSSGGVLGLFSGTETTRTITVAPGLARLTEELVDRVNTLAGTEVVTLGEAIDADEPAAGEILVDEGPGAPHTTVWTTATRIERARVRVDATADSGIGNRDRTLRVMLQALGVGETAVGDRVTGRAGGADNGGTRAALAHLYDGACDQDPRLDLRAPGHPSQAGVTGARERVDLASTTTSPRKAAVEAAAWLRSRRGDGWARTVVVCRDDVFADCLAGSSLLAGGGVVLLVPGGPDASLPAEVRDELDATAAPGGRLVLLGGPRAVSTTIEEDLRRAFPRRDVQRVQGADRYATARAVADLLDPAPGATTLLARGDDPADAVAAGAWAARTGTPILLTTPDRMVPTTASFLDARSPGRIILLGGEAALGRGVAASAREHAPVSRVAGPSRTATATAIARSPHLWGRTAMDDTAATVAVGAFAPNSWQLAVAAAGVGAELDAPLLYVAPDAVPSAGRGGWDTREQLTGLRANGTDVRATSVLLGAGLAGVSDSVADAFHALHAAGVSGRVTIVGPQPGLLSGAP